MATPMNITANEFNINNGIATLDQDVTNISTISSTNAIIKHNKTRQSHRNLLLDFMYTREEHYPTNLFWYDNSTITTPIVPPRPVKAQLINNNNKAPVLPPRPAKELDVQSTDKDTSILSSAQPIDYDTSNTTNEPQQDQFIKNMINSIIAKSISDATSTTKILDRKSVV